MKRQIIAAICSAIIIPGLGQILNQHLKKGLTILAIIFVLFLAGTVKLSLLINTLLTGQNINRLDYAVVMDRLQKADHTLLWILFIIFVVVWLYSVIDAFFGGKKQKSETER